MRTPKIIKEFEYENYTWEQVAQKYGTPFEDLQKYRYNFLMNEGYYGEGRNQVECETLHEYLTAVAKDRSFITNVSNDEISSEFAY